MKIITVSREFGSGGREIGKRLADELGVAYYDREILSAVAEKSSLDEKYIEHTLEKGLFANYPLRFSRSFATVPMSETANILAKQHKVLKEIAQKGDCVIVGRGADVILKNYNPFNLFVYADMSSKIKRCRIRECAGQNLSDREYEKKIKQIDKSRKDIHGIISPNTWGDKSFYNLCINTTDMEIKDLIPSVAAYAKAWFERSTK